jgi:hypothetical protein
MMILVSFQDQNWRQGWEEQYLVQNADPTAVTGAAAASCPGTVLQVDPWGASVVNSLAGCQHQGVHL